MNDKHVNHVIQENSFFDTVYGISIIIACSDFAADLDKTIGFLKKTGMPRLQTH